MDSERSPKNFSKKTENKNKKPLAAELGGVDEVRGFARELHLAPLAGGYQVVAIALKMDLIDLRGVSAERFTGC